MSWLETKEKGKLSLPHSVVFIKQGFSQGIMRSDFHLPLYLDRLVQTPHAIGSLSSLMLGPATMTTESSTWALHAENTESTFSFNISVDFGSPRIA